jgi:hypothetical protein
MSVKRVYTIIMIDFIRISCIIVTDLFFAVLRWLIRLCQHSKKLIINQEKEGEAYETPLEIFNIIAHIKYLFDSKHCVELGAVVIPSPRSGSTISHKSTQQPGKYYHQYIAVKHSYIVQWIHSA